MKNGNQLIWSHPSPSTFSWHLNTCMPLEEDKMLNSLDGQAYGHIGIAHFGYKTVRLVLKEKLAVNMWLSDNQYVFI